MCNHFAVSPDIFDTSLLRIGRWHSMLLCVPNSVFSCTSCAVIPALWLSPLWCSLELCALCMYPCVLLISVQCVRALSLFVCCYSCALHVAYSRAFPSAMYSCILCCDPTLCLSPMWCSFCVLYVSVHAVYFSTMCVCVLYPFFVCYYSLRCVKFIHVCSCATFRASLRVSRVA